MLGLLNALLSYPFRVMSDEQLSCGVEGGSVRLRTSAPCSRDASHRTPHSAQVTGQTSAGGGRGAEPQASDVCDKTKGVAWGCWGVWGRSELITEQKTSFDLSKPRSEVLSTVRVVSSEYGNGSEGFSPYLHSTVYSFTGFTITPTPHHVLVDAGCLRVITCA